MLVKTVATKEYILSCYLYLLIPSNTSASESPAVLFSTAESLDSLHVPSDLLYWYAMHSFSVRDKQWAAQPVDVEVLHSMLTDCRLPFSFFLNHCWSTL